MAQGRILLVDDEEDLNAVMKRGLEIAGFEVDAEHNPVDALSKFQKGRYDMALLDIKMPGMDGLELYQRLSQIDSKMKVCFLTAFDIDYFEKFRARFPHVPTRCFIKKPVSLRNLIDMVRTELGAATEA